MLNSSAATVSVCDPIPELSVPRRNDVDVRKHVPPRGRLFDLTLRRYNLVRSMINVTDNAVRQLRILLEAQAPAERQGLRVQIAKGGCSGLQYEMSLDGQRAGDSIVEKDGVEFLVDGESADYLRGATLDYRDGLTGTGFHIENPNAARTCGCGTSFEAARPA